MKKIEVVLAEGIVVGPNDRLLIKLPEGADLPGGVDATQELIEDFRAALRDIGLEDRTLVVVGEIEITKIEGGPTGLPDDYWETAT